MKKIIKKIISVLIIFGIIFWVNNKEPKTNVTQSQNKEVEELKQEYKMTGDNEIYNVETEYDGRKVLTVKPSINYKIAFTGMIKNTKPDLKEVDSIFESTSPTKAGIWIKKENREKILTYLNNNLNNEYKINNEGYLQIKEVDNPKNEDKKIEKLINGDKQYIFCISSVCYMVDPVTGQIIDNPYNELEPYQTYEYFKDKDRMIIFITENEEQKITQNEIFESILELIELT